MASEQINRADLAILARQQTARSPRPFVSWAGSKRRLLPQIVRHLPASYGTYFEPFLGGGSLALLLKPQVAFFGDACVPLLDAWRAVKLAPHAVFAQLSNWSLDKQTYYRVRGLIPSRLVERGAQFIYLNRGAFNGLWRVNKSGQFNVPWGAPKTDFVADRENLVAVSRYLRGASTEFSSGDFEPLVELSKRNDLVFLDPPYVTSHNDNGFIDYNEKLFSWSDQARLATTAERARLRGAHVIVTNANHEAVRELYPNFSSHSIERASTLAANSSKRGRVTELLLVGTSG